MKRGSISFLLAVAMQAANAQPVVPSGFIIRRIAPLQVNRVPQLAAINDPKPKITDEHYGVGVATSSAGNGVVVFNFIEQSGIIRPLGVFADPNAFLALRIRHDDDFLIDGLLHATIGFDGMEPFPFRSERTSWVTIDGDGLITERNLIGGDQNEVGYDFDFASIGTNGALVMVDANGDDGTSLAIGATDFSILEINPDSVPPGNNDTDVAGLRRDVVGSYGGGLLLADSDCNSSSAPDSTIWSMTNISQGGTYSPITSVTHCTIRNYGDLDIASSGAFGGVIYVTETNSNQIQQVSPSGIHTTWATGFVGIDSLSISPEGDAMYVADLTGVWLIQPNGAESGPVVLARDPVAPTGSPITGNPLTSVRLIFSEAVTFTDNDVAITNANGQSILFEAFGSGSQFMVIGFSVPLNDDTYSISVFDNITAVATGQRLDGNNDGAPGGNYLFDLTHVRRSADLDIDGDVDVVDFADFQSQFTGPLP